MWNGKEPCVKREDLEPPAGRDGDNIVYDIVVFFSSGPIMLMQNSVTAGGEISLDEPTLLEPLCGVDDGTWAPEALLLLLPLPSLVTEALIAAPAPLGLRLWLARGAREGAAALMSRARVAASMLAAQPIPFCNGLPALELPPARTSPPAVIPWGSELITAVTTGAELVPPPETAPKPILALRRPPLLPRPLALLEDGRRNGGAEAVGGVLRRRVLFFSTEPRPTPRAAPSATGKTSPAPLLPRGTLSMWPSPLATLGSVRAGTSCAVSSVSTEPVPMTDVVRNLWLPGKKSGGGPAICQGTGTAPSSVAAEPLAVEVVRGMLQVASTETTWASSGWTGIAADVLLDGRRSEVWCQVLATLDLRRVFVGRGLLRGGGHVGKAVLRGGPHNASTSSTKNDWIRRKRSNPMGPSG